VPARRDLTGGGSGDPQWWKDREEVVESQSEEQNRRIATAVARGGIDNEEDSDLAARLATDVRDDLRLHRAVQARMSTEYADILTKFGKWSLNRILDWNDKVKLPPDVLLRLFDSTTRALKQSEDFIQSVAEGPEVITGKKRRVKIDATSREERSRRAVLADLLLHIDTNIAKEARKRMAAEDAAKAAAAELESKANGSDASKAIIELTPVEPNGSG
jgi:hypothetical protein